MTLRTRRWHCDHTHQKQPGSQIMIKSELITRIAARHRETSDEQDPERQLSHRDYERVVSTVFDEITAALARGNRVEVTWFRRILREASTRTGQPQPRARVKP